jgi:hypothetical protein
MRSADIQLRDSALARVSRVKRWTIAAAAALTAGLAYLASALVPGKSLGAKARMPARTQTTAPKSASSTVTPPLPAAAGPSQLGLQGPSQPPESVPAPSDPSQSAAPPAPAPAAAPPAAVSGGS